MQSNLYFVFLLLPFITFVFYKVLIINSLYYDNLPTIKNSSKQLIFSSFTKKDAYAN